jgi:phosphoadenosine phosphosulfate reductase
MHLAVEPPELIKFLKEFYPEVKIIKPTISIFKLIEKKGFPPTGYRRYCCEEFKEKYGEDRTVVTGVRWEESIKRRDRRMVEVCHKNARINYLHPIIDWTSVEVWQYIRQHNLPYCKLYDEGWKRLGCIGCPMGVNQKRELERWPKYKKAYLNCFNKIIENKKDTERESKWKSGEEIMEWWLDKKRQKVDENQSVIFE